MRLCSAELKPSAHVTVLPKASPASGSKRKRWDMQGGLLSTASATASASASTSTAPARRVPRRAARQSPPTSATAPVATAGSNDELARGFVSQQRSDEGAFVVAVWLWIAQPNL